MEAGDEVGLFLSRMVDLPLRGLEVGPVSDRQDCSKEGVLDRACALHLLYQSAMVTMMLQNKLAQHSVVSLSSLCAHAHGLRLFCISADVEQVTWEALLQAVGPLGRAPGFRLGSGWLQPMMLGSRLETGCYPRHVLRRDHWMQKAGLASPFMACVRVTLSNIQVVKESPRPKPTSTRQGCLPPTAGRGRE